LEREKNALETVAIFLSMLANWKRGGGGGGFRLVGRARGVVLGHVTVILKWGGGLSTFALGGGRESQKGGFRYLWSQHEVIDISPGCSSLVRKLSFVVCGSGRNSGHPPLKRRPPQCLTHLKKPPSAGQCPSSP